MCEGGAVSVSVCNSGLGFKTPGSRLAHLVYITFLRVMLPDRALCHLPIPPSPVPQDGRCCCDSKDGCTSTANINAVLVLPC